MKKYIVVQDFVDKNDFSKHYKPGDELPGSFEQSRLANIVKLGLAKVEGDETGEPKAPKEPKTPKAPKEPAEPVTE